MSLIKLRIDYLLFGGSGFVLLLSIITADFQDPTFFNQLYPSAGIQNWIGLIGAITGGSLLEIFGPSVLLLPWLFVRIFLHQPRSVSQSQEVLYWKSLGRQSCCFHGSLCVYFCTNHVVFLFWQALIMRLCSYFYFRYFMNLL